MAEAEVGGHHRAPAAALRAEALVAEAAHQLDPESRDALGIHAGLGRVVGEAVAGHRRADDVEGVGRIAAVLRGVGERTDDLLELAHRAGPAMRDHQRQRLRPDALLVDHVDAEAADLRLELGEAVEARFRGAPVETVAPVGDELAYRAEVGAVAPARARDLVREARARKALAQVRQHGIGHVDAEGYDLHPQRAVTRNGRKQARTGTLPGPSAGPGFALEAGQDGADERVLDEADHDLEGAGRGVLDPP